MKKQLVYPVFALAGGLLCAVVRGLQLQSGFEADTGLPIPGNPCARILAAALVLLALVWIVLARRIPQARQNPADGFAESFRSRQALSATVFAAGIFCWIAAGAVQLVRALTGTALLTGAVWGLVTILAAVCLFPALLACRKPQPAFPANALLGPVVYLVVALVVAYRDSSVQPSVQTYYPTLLALAALILAFFHVAAFTFRDGHPRRMVLWSALSVTLCLPALVGQSSRFYLLLFAGGALMQLGLLQLYLEASESA